MSSTNRGTERQDSDNYPTPAWCVYRLMETVNLPTGIRWLEPACGDGAIIRAVNAHCVAFGAPLPTWTAIDIREECRTPVEAAGAKFQCCDFLGHEFSTFSTGIVITNPPYSLAQGFIDRCIEGSHVTAMLLRLNYLGSEKRAAFMRANPPDVYVLPNRPAFVNGKTDSCEYAWFVWGLGGGRLRVLAPTPAAERRCAR